MVELLDYLSGQTCFVHLCAVFNHILKPTEAVVPVLFLCAKTCPWALDTLVMLFICRLWEVLRTWCRLTWRHTSWVNSMRRGHKSWKIFYPTGSALLKRALLMTSRSSELVFSCFSYSFSSLCWKLMLNLLFMLQRYVHSATLDTEIDQAVKCIAARCISCNARCLIPVLFLWSICPD